ncbi:MAG: hypothetical protein EXR99_00100 [Gemmataceae bacterium]|nr:hypothetical protein [Gemmataceae bacterium]
MACRQTFRWITASVALAFFFSPLAQADSHCPFCTMQGQTLIGEVNQANLVLFGTLKNPKLGNANGSDGTTDFEIESVIKDHAFRGDKKALTLPRYVPPDKDGKYKFLLFCEVYKGKLDPYRGVAIPPDSEIVKYLKGALEIKDKTVPKRLEFYFNFLENADLEISNDAYKEFGNASYKDFQEAAKGFSRDKVLAWLNNPETAAFKTGLYASILGHVGQEKDAVVLKQLLENPDKQTGTGIDGVFTAYCLLNKKAGWDYLTGILKNPKKEFLFRYAGLRAIRFLLEFRPDVIEKKQLVEAILVLNEQDDISDLAIEDLRKWQVWEAADQVLGLQEKEFFKKIPIVRRAVLRYALSCKGNKAADAYVKKMRGTDPQGVIDAEELLKLEQPPPAK